MLLSNQQWAENWTKLTMEKNLGAYCTFSSILWEDFSEYIFLVVFIASEKLHILRWWIKSTLKYFNTTLHSKIL